MSSILWQSKNTGKYSYTLKPWYHGSLTECSSDYNELGSYIHIINKIKSYMYSQTFSRRRILKEPARYAAYFVFIHREVKLEMTHEYNILAELLESVDPNIWVQNRDVVNLLLEGLITYSIKL